MNAGNYYKYWWNKTINNKNVVGLKNCLFINLEAHIHDH